MSELDDVLGALDQELGVSVVASSTEPKPPLQDSVPPSWVEGASRAAPGLRAIASSPAAESLRSAALANFRSAAKDLDPRLCGPVLDSWITGRKGIEDRIPDRDGRQWDDPVIPWRFVDKVDANIMSALAGPDESLEPEVRRLSRKLGKLAHRFHRQLRQNLLGLKSVRSVTTSFQDHGMCSLRSGKTVLVVTKVHFDKLLKLYNRYGGDAGTTAAKGSPEFQERLYSLLLRYESTTVGWEFFDALTPGVFEALRTYFGVKFECFASPLDAYYGRYCSAFRDTDRCFGSEGSFFSFYPSEGSFVAHPPRIPSLIRGAVAHMIALLANASAGRASDARRRRDDLEASTGGHSGEPAQTEQELEEQDEGPPLVEGGDSSGSAGRPLSFIVFVPHQPEAKWWKQLQNSSFLRQSELFFPGDTTQVDGDQHLRGARHRSNRVAASLFVLQTNLAAQQWPPSHRAMQEVLSAFAAEKQKLVKEGGVKKRKSAVCPSGPASQAKRPKPLKVQRGGVAKV